MSRVSKGSMVFALAALTLAWVSTAAALSPTQKCEKSKNKAAAKYGQCIAGQRGKEIAGKIPDYTGCATKLSDAFATAEGKGGCPTTGDAATILSRVNGVYDPDNALPKWFSNTRFVEQR